MTRFLLLWRNKACYLRNPDIILFTGGDARATSCFLAFFTAFLACARTIIWKYDSHFRSLWLGSGLRSTCWAIYGRGKGAYRIPLNTECVVILMDFQRIDNVRLVCLLPSSPTPMAWRSWPDDTQTLRDWKPLKRAVRPPATTINICTLKPSVYEGSLFHRMSLLLFKYVAVMPTASAPGAIARDDITVPGLFARGHACPWRPDEGSCWPSSAVSSEVVPPPQTLG